MLAAVRGVALAAQAGVVVKASGGYGRVPVRLGESIGEPFRLRHVDRLAGSVARRDPGEQQPPLIASAALPGSVVGVALRRRPALPVSRSGAGWDEFDTC